MAQIAGMDDTMISHLISRLASIGLDLDLENIMPVERNHHTHNEEGKRKREKEYKPNIYKNFIR